MVTDEDEIERTFLAHSPRLRAILDAAEQQIREGKGVKHEDFWRDIDAETTGGGFTAPAPDGRDAAAPHA
ncbi:MAG: hypothetical protein HYX92_22395 [Chloroflexi bacterium]|nr:hypothetical protein [Chloroflexota bacterium]